MRKFKFMPKLAAGMMAIAMTFGSLSGLGMNTPVTVYAAPVATSIEVTVKPQVVAPNGSATYTAVVRDENGDVMESPTVAWTVAGGITGTAFSSNTLKVAEKETAKVLTITAKSGDATVSFEVMVGEGAYLDVKYEDMSATIVSNDANDSFFFLEVLKDENGTKPGTVYCYEKDAKASETAKVPTTAKIDLSFLKLSKPVYVRVYSDQNPTPLKIYTIAAQPKKPSVKYVAGQDTFYKSFQLNKKDLDATTVKTLQWKSQYGATWNDFTSLEQNMDTLTVAGSTILVRAISADGNAPATTEVKVKIAAVPKAPKVTLDYAKNAIKLPKGSEIRVPGWVIPAEQKVGEDFIDVSTPFYFTVGTNKDDLTVAPKVLAEKLIDKYISEYNTARGRLSNKTIQDSYPELTTEDEKNEDGSIKNPSDRTDYLDDFKDNGYSFLIRTAKGKKAASQPTFVDVKSAPVIAIRQKDDPNSKADPKTKINEDVIAVQGLNDKGEVIATANTLTFAYTDTELKLTPAGSYVYSYSLDGGAKYSKLSKDTSIKLEKIDATKGILIRTEGVKADAKKKVEGDWASNELKLPVVPAKVEISGKTEFTAGDTVKETYKVVVKDALGQEIKNATVKWSASATGAIVEGTGVFTVPASAGKVTITATYTDTTRGVEVKGTIEVEVKAKETTN